MVVMLTDLFDQLLFDEEWNPPRSSLVKLFLRFSEGPSHPRPVPECTVPHAEFLFPFVICWFFSSDPITETAKSICEREVHTVETREGETPLL